MNYLKCALATINVLATTLISDIYNVEASAQTELNPHLISADEKPGFDCEYLDYDRLQPKQAYAVSANNPFTQHISPCIMTEVANTMKECSRLIVNSKELSISNIDDCIAWKIFGVADGKFDFGETHLTAALTRNKRICTHKAVDGEKNCINAMSMIYLQTDDGGSCFITLPPEGKVATCYDSVVANNDFFRAIQYDKDLQYDKGYGADRNFRETVEQLSDLSIRGKMFNQAAGYGISDLWQWNAKQDKYKYFAPEGFLSLSEYGSDNIGGRSYGSINIRNTRAGFSQLFFAALLKGKRQLRKDGTIKITFRTVVESSGKMRGEAILSKDKQRLTGETKATFFVGSEEVLATFNWTAKRVRANF